MRPFFRPILLVLIWFSMLSPAAAREALLPSLRALAPDAPVAALRQALRARDCAVSSGDAGPSGRLAVIDYSLPSTEPRLWVFELEPQPRLLFVEHVAHGRGSGEDLAQQFSNVEGSHQSSLGLFRTAETYQGANGYSMRLDGLEPGINDRARERAIVMHGADYVDPDLARQQARLGRSFGCPSVRTRVARQVIDALREGQLLFAYYPDRDWLEASPFLACSPREGAAAALAAAAAGAPGATRATTFASSPTAMSTGE